MHWQRGFGKSGWSAGRGNGPDIIYRLGSVTKQFTAAAILLLQEDGLLSLQDNVRSFIDDFPNGDIFTLHHLLTHSSGMSNYTALSDFPEKALEYHSPQQLFAIFRRFTAGVFTGHLI